MITRIKINGFKSFHNFEMEFAPFTVVAGANASGKSNLFDALKLLAAFAESDNLKKAVSGQRGNLTELFTQYGPNEYAREMEFEVEMLVDNMVTDGWGNQHEIKYTRLLYGLRIGRVTNTFGIEDIVVKHEQLVNLKHEDDKWLKKHIKNTEDVFHWRPKVVTGKRGVPYMLTEGENGIPTVLVPQDGTQGNKRRFPLINATRTVLSSFDSVDFPHVLAAKEEMRKWRFLELNPEDLRQPTSKNEGDDKITPGGKNLAGALYRISLADKYVLKEISRKLAVFLPNFTDVSIIDDRENNQYVIKLKDIDKKEYTSRVLSEGTLRILTLCILQFDPVHNGLLCFEEPENGVHPFRVKAVVELLRDLSVDFTDHEMPLRQVIINTHSPKLVGSVLDLYLDNPGVSLYLTQMMNRKTTFGQNGSAKEVNVAVTSVVNPFIDFVEPPNKIGGLGAAEEKEGKKRYGMSKVLKYLDATEFDSVKKKIESTWQDS